MKNYKVFHYSGLTFLFMAFLGRVLGVPGKLFWILFVTAITLKAIFLSGNFRLLYMIPVLLMAVTCAGPLSDSISSRDTTDIYIVEMDWHAEIAFRRGDIPGEIWPEISEFPRAGFLQVGWGDSAYFQTRDPGILLTLQAGVLPTPSVLHVSGFQIPVTELFDHSRVVRIPVNTDQLHILAEYIHQAYARDPEGDIIIAGEGLFRNSYFYKGTESYTIFRNCNTWVASALEEAGFPLNPRITLTVENLMQNVREFGKPPDQIHP